MPLLPRQRRLAAAVGAGDDHQLAVADVQVHILEHLLPVRRGPGDVI